MFAGTYKSDGEWVHFSMNAPTSIHEAFDVARELVGQKVGLSVQRIDTDDLTDQEWVTQRTPSWVR